jgi:hypothetical protein
MPNRVMGLLLASDENALLDLAKRRNWTILPKTGYTFERFKSDDDQSLPFVEDMDGVAVNGRGCAALAYRDE